MPKLKKDKKQRHDTLEKQLSRDENPVLKNKQSRQDPNDSDDDMSMSNVMSDKLSRKTLMLAKEQQLEEDQYQARAQYKENARMNMKSRVTVSSDSEEDSDDDLENVDYDAEDLVRYNDGYVEDIEVTEADEKALSSFMMGGFGERRNLADIILEKIREKEERKNRPPEPEQASGFDPKIVEVYNGVGKILKRYTAGKLPKAFKIVPSLSSWEDILCLTNPEEWSPHAMRAATRLFASNLNPKMAQRFYNIFLLEHVRQDIRNNKRLNYHLYMALKKSLYKPQAFFKGIILPLCESRNCSIREATIIGSVLSKVSIPVIHSAAALLKIAEMPYSGANSVFIGILLNKKYSLPKRVVSELCNHFASFTNDERQMPVLWHQALLTFAQRYKGDINREEKERFKVLLKNQFHHQITPEIRRELFME